MGSAASSAPQSPNFGSELISSSQGCFHSHDESCAYLVASPRRHETPVPYNYALDASTDTAVCCVSTPRDASVSFISREEALIKARYYKDRNQELAKQAYLFALNFPSTKYSGKPHKLEGSLSPSNCGCSFVRCSIPQPVSSCWALGRSSPHLYTGAGGESVQKMSSAEAMSTAFTSSTVSRLHTDDLDELVVHNPVAQRLHLADVSVHASEKQEYGQFGDSEFRAQIHAELAQLYLMSGEPLEALECYKNASVLAPGQLVYLYRRGVVLQQLGQRDKAISCFRSVLSTDPGYKPAIFNLGVCLADDPATSEEALRMFELLLTIDPNNENALDMIADIHEKEGRVSEAYTAKQKLVSLDPSNFRAGRELARLKATLVGRGAMPGYVTLN